MFGGQVLKDERTLGHYNNDRDMTVRLALTAGLGLRGGTGGPASPPQLPDGVSGAVALGGDGFADDRTRELFTTFARWPALTAGDTDAPAAHVVALQLLTALLPQSQPTAATPLHGQATELIDAMASPSPAFYSLTPGAALQTLQSCIESGAGTLRSSVDAFAASGMDALSCRFAPPPERGAGGVEKWFCDVCDRPTTECAGHQGWAHSHCVGGGTFWPQKSNKQYKEILERKKS